MENFTSSKIVLRWEPQAAQQGDGPVLGPQPAPRPAPPAGLPPRRPLPSPADSSEFHAPQSSLRHGPERNNTIHGIRWITQRPEQGSRLQSSGQRRRCPQSKETTSTENGHLAVIHGSLQQILWVLEAPQDLIQERAVDMLFLQDKRSL